MPDEKEQKDVVPPTPREVRGVLTGDSTIERKGGVEVGGRPGTQRPTDARPQGVQASALQGANGQNGGQSGAVPDGTPSRPKE